MRLKDDLFNKGVKGQKLKKRHLKLLYIKTIFHIHLNKQPHYGQNNGQIIFVERFSLQNSGIDRNNIIYVKIKWLCKLTQTILRKRRTVSTDLKIESIFAPCSVKYGC